MIPLRDVIPSRTTPYVTIALIALNAFVWIYELALPREALPIFLQRYGVVPADFTTPALVSSMFLHGSWMHVIGNMWCLWIFGDNVEDTMGHVRFALFYLVAGTTSPLGLIVLGPESPFPAIGASGAIAGVMGAYFVMFPQSRVLTLLPLIVSVEIIELPAVLLLGLWLVIQLLGTGAIAMTANAQHLGVALIAHVAGLAVGAIGVLGVRRRREWGVDHM